MFESWFVMARNFSGRRELLAFAQACFLPSVSPSLAAPQAAIKSVLVFKGGELHNFMPSGKARFSEHNLCVGFM